jgi:ABC-type transporter Mla subunit MlaD
MAIAHERKTFSQRGEAMPQKNNELKVGVTVVVIVLLALTVIAFIGRWDSLFRSEKTFRVRFLQQYGVEGLRTSDPVAIGGVTLGRVQEIRTDIDKEDGQLYIVVISDIPSYIDIYSDARVTVEGKLLGDGGRLVVLHTGQHGKKLGPDDCVEGLPPRGLSQIYRMLDTSDPSSMAGMITYQLDAKKEDSLLAKLQTSMDDLNAISANIRHETTAAEKASIAAKVHEVIDNINVITTSVRGELDRDNSKATLVKLYSALDNLNEGLVTARQMLNDNRPKVDETMTHIANTAKNLDAELDRTKSDSLLTKIHGSVDAAQKGLENFRDISQTGVELVVVNRENLQAMVDNFVETSAHLKATAKDVRQNPWLLLYKPDQPEREYGNLMSAARSFSDAAGALDHANVKLVELMRLRPDGVTANDPQLSAIRDQIKQAACQFEEAQSKLYELLKIKK